MPNTGTNSGGGQTVIPTPPVLSTVGPGSAQTIVPPAAGNTPSPVPSVNSTTPIDATTLASNTSSFTLPPAPPAPPIYDVSKLGSAFSLTPGESAAQDISNTVQGLTTEDAAKAGFTIDQYKALGYGVTTDANGNIVASDPQLNDLNTQLTTLQNQAQAIPLQEQQNAAGRGETTAGLAPIQTGDLRNNAIQALTVSSLIAARQGKMATAQMMVENAGDQKFGPIEAQLKAAQAYLATLSASPELSLEEKQQAQEQAVQLAQRQAQLDLAKTTYTNTQNEILKYAPTATAQQLQAMQQARTPAEADQIAASMGLMQPISGRYQPQVSTITNALGQQEPVIITTDSITGNQVGAPQPYKGSSSPGTVIGSSPTPPAGTAPTSTPGATPVTPGPQNAGGASTGQGTNPTPSRTSPTGFSTTTGSGQNKLPLAQYGLLANTNLNPNNSIDQMALNYINAYLKNGTAPTATSIGRGITPAGFGQVVQRANELFQQATGNSLSGVNPEIVSGYQTLINNNNRLLNSLGYQQGTINKNFALALANMKSGNINTAIQPINEAVNNIQELLCDPSMQQYLAQNATLSNELANIIAVKNAGGTTVHDKNTGEELLPANATQDQQYQELGTLIKEAQNSASSIQEQSGSIYSQIDPLMQDPNNPNRTHLMNAQ